MSNSISSSQLLALHRHLTNALLKPVCPDIQLKAFNRIYNLHRIFLVQSAFFNSLLNGDFKEAKDKKGVWKRSQLKKASSRSEIHTEGEDEDNAVLLQFDDPNITRPAFEYCLATLYGAAPTLVLPSWSCPSPEFPLTSHFQLDFSSQSIKSPTFSSTSPVERTEKAEHPATPRFLLSLIATATYLGIPSVCSQAVTLILCSITPYTVSQYLRFSLGLGILGAQEAKDRQEGRHSEWDWELEGPAWGLEGLSQECKPTSRSYSSLLERTEGLSMHDDQEEEEEEDDEEEEDEGKAGSDRSDTSSPSTKGAKESSAESFLPSFLSDRDNLLSHQGRFYYGAQSDKIGEACSCWLLRWGADVLLVEEQMQFDDDVQEAPLYIASFTLPRNVLPIPHSLTPSDDFHTNVANVLSAPHPTVWCHPKLGGIPANWTRIIISSDSFWIRSEWDRYDVARRVVAMRRGHFDDFVEADENVSEEEGGEEELIAGQGKEKYGADKAAAFSSTIQKEVRSSKSPSVMESNGSVEGSEGNVDEDEGDYSTLFSEGIYYTHMTFEELSAISNQVCSSTGSTYVPMNVLQSALWAQSELKGMILNKEKENLDPSKEVSTPEEEVEEPSSNSRTATTSNRAAATNNINRHQERELGLVSKEADFASAYQSLQRRGRSSRLNSSITSSDSFNNLNTATGTTVLGGMRPLMLLGGASKTKALENLLDKRFFAVPSDDTVRFGENLSSLLNTNGGGEAIRGEKSVDERGGASGIAAVIDSQTLSIAHDSKRPGMSEYFGVQNAVKSGRQLGQEEFARLSTLPGGVEARSTNQAGGDQWTGYEPMRLGVEFFGVDRLKEKERMYSPSFFYAGSIWNLYLQIIKKPKGLQLGIYLHRQNCNDTLPNPSYPSDMMTEVLTGGGAGGAGGAGGVAVGGMVDNSSNEPQTPRRREVAGNGGLTGSIFYSSSSSPAGSSHIGAGGGVGVGVGVGAGGDNSSSSTPVQNPRQDQQGRPSSTNVRQRSYLTPHSHNQQQQQQQYNHHQSSSSSSSYHHHGISLTPSPTSNCIVTNASAANNSNLYNNNNTTTNQQSQYQDQRRILRAYFSVHCPSPLGTSLTRFSSRPDNFSLSQSWGWKSSSLLGSVYLSENKIGTAENQVSPIFRCIVNVGVV